MKYSIITINYNNCDGLCRTIESVISQTFKDYEFIIIDGGSTDGSIDIIKKYQQHISYWVSEKDEGIYNAMNKDGVDKFQIVLVEVCYIEELSIREIYWIEYFNTYKNGYNATRGGDGRRRYVYELIVSL